MEAFLIFCLLVVLLFRWLYLRSRLNEMDERMRILERMTMREAPRPAAQVAQESPPVEPPAAVAPVTVPTAPIFPPVAAVPAPPAPAFAPAAAAPTPPAPAPPVPAPAPARRSSEDWEALVGGNWLNKVGVFVLVIGIALALGYSYTRLGPVGRVGTSLVISFAMLIAGAALEPRERYRTFARGLLGGGWAALYFTVYAMQSLEAARIIHSPWTGAFLLLAVATGMILHSLRYRSETVAGLAYFLAFVTLAITEVTSLSVLALIPLAASLLYVAHRFSWRWFAVCGAVATYLTCGLRGDTGAPLWQAQAIFAAYWLLFEAFDILRPHAALLPLNTLGFLTLSLVKWNHAAPERIWQFLAAAAAGYLAGAILRARSGRWHAASTVCAALAAAAILLKLEYQWVALALVVEGELFYLAGVRFRAPYLRYLAGALFILELGHLAGRELPQLPARAWTPLAALQAAVFYANRALLPADVVYGYAAAGMMALVAGYEAGAPFRGRAWYALAAGTFGFGWWRRLADFRFQGYALAILGAIGTALFAPHPPLALAAGAAAGYTATLCAVWSGADRFGERERAALRLAASLATTGMLAALVWRLVPDGYLGVAWMALAVVLLEAGMRGLPPDLLRQSYGLAGLGAALVVTQNLAVLHNQGPMGPRLVPLGAALCAYAMAARARGEERGRVLDIASFIGAGMLAAAVWSLLPPSAAGPVWAALALAPLYAGLRGDVESFRWQSYALAALAFARCWWTGHSAPLLSSCLAIACLYAAQFLPARGSRPRIYFSLLASVLAAALLYYRVSGSLLTVAWGMEGVALLSSGFPLRDRVPRLSGLALLVFCILKLFVWDLRHLETLPRILSFLVLGMILVAVSWIYTRFRERVARYF